LSLDDLMYLRRAIALSGHSRAEGHHPFAALLVDNAGVVMAEAINGSSTDRTAHAEMLALRRAAILPGEKLRGATLYSSAEPCAMCAGGAYWAGIGRVVYALSEERLLALTGSDPENPTLALPCREVFARGQRLIEVVGPMLEEEAAAVHSGFWSR
jgi:tRNA(Arg) A34 adenosine deaminase TadA